MSRRKFSSVALAITIAFVGSAGVPAERFPGSVAAGFIGAAQAQSSPYGLTIRPSLQGVNMPFAGEGPPVGVRINPAFPKLSFLTPLYVTAAPGDDSHLYVVEQRGVIRRFENRSDVTKSTVFLDMRGLVTDRGGEEGLLGLAFHPNYASNGRLFVYYSPADGTRRTVVARFIRSASDPSTADMTTLKNLFTISQPTVIHKGGCLQFGPDGKLYIATGDGGPGDDPNNNSQNIDRLQGKILRVNVDGSSFSAPTDNPFYAAAGDFRSRVWAYGLRNPFRFSFDKATGKLWAGDAGQHRVEEINIVAKGGNYGWRVYEGNLSNINPDNLPASNFRSPAFSYLHESTNPDDVVLGRAVTGGYVYRGSRIPSLVGRYLFADFIAGRVWALEQNNGTIEGVEPVGDVPLPASFGEDNAGNLYLVSLEGTIHRIDPAEEGELPQPPELLSQTGLFADVVTLAPNRGLIEYQLRAPFWSDGALKRRWVGIPDGKTIGFTATDAWKWPARTLTVKHFEIMLATGARKRLETRVIVNTDQGWRFYSYRWNESETDAVLLPDARSAVTLNVMDPASSSGSRSQTYVFPSRDDCRRCHSQAAGVILGPRTPQMNRTFVYPGSVEDNQLRTFNHIGLFDRDIGSPAQYDVLASPTDTSLSLQLRARAYLESNCSQCHRPGGPTRVNLNLLASTPNDQMNAIGVSPTVGRLGLYEPSIIRAGSKSRSVLWERMRRLNDAEDTRMPIIGSYLVDTQGVALIGQWIDSLSTTPSPPSVSFTASSQTVSESAGTASLRVQLSAATAATVSVPITIGGTASSGADFSLSTTALSIPAGSTSATRNITLIDDLLDEPVETIIISLGTPTNASLGSTSQHTLSLSDNDGPPNSAMPAVSLTVATGTVSESSAKAYVTVLLSAATSQPVTIPVAFGGTATRLSTGDYTAATTPITIAAGSTTGSRTITLVNDALDEDTETVTLTLATPTNATLGSITRHTLSIIDDDPYPSLSFLSAKRTVKAGGGQHRIRVLLSSPSGREVRVAINRGGSAQPRADFTIDPPRVLRISPGSRFADLHLNVVGKSQPEPRKKISLSLASATNAELGEIREHVIRIRAHD